MPTSRSRVQVRPRPSEDGVVPDLTYRPGSAYDAPVTRVAAEPRPTTTMAGAAAPETTVPEIVRRRLAPPTPLPAVWSWTATAVVTLIAAIVRLVDLGRPGQIIFDETYYAPNAYALLRYGTEWEVVEGGADPVDGAPVLGDGPAYVVHPPLGKWLIGLGEAALGYHPTGWRIAAAVAGILSVLLITRIAQRLFGSVALGAMAGLLVALDGMHVVTSRTALLDIFLALFVVAAFATLLRDRQWQRSRWLAALAAGRHRPLTALPWWRFATAALLGCAVAVKWSAGFYVLAFLLLLLWWELGLRRSAGLARPVRSVLRQETPGLLASGAVLVTVYLASWSGWFASYQGYHRLDPVDVRGSALPARIAGSVWNLIQYHIQAITFHSGLDSAHPYSSPAWQWLLLARPTAFHWSGEGTCGAEQCASTVLLLGTPVLWWSFLPALAVLLWLAIARRDWRAGAILVAAAAGIVPWFFFPERVMFYFYALPAEPFLVLAVVYVFGALITPGRSGRTTLFGFDRRVAAAVLAGAYLLLVAACFAYFYPLYTGQVIPYEAWQDRIWVSSWV